MPLSESDLPFTIGIEEEYLLVDPATRNPVDETALQEGVIREVADTLSEDVGFVTPEFLRAQVEVGTAVCGSVKEVSDKLRRLRRSVATAARNHGVALIASSTHPSANWRTLEHTDKERYHVLARDLQGVAQRLVICGMHVHVGINDNDSRIDLLNQISYFLPHLLALSTSSPFWSGRNSGLMSYRLAVFDELPRTGLPEHFDSWTDYERHLAMLAEAKVMEDPSKLWWDIRPHSKFPTLEMRVPDICTYLDDGIAVAALYACLLSMLQRLRLKNQRWRVYSNMLITENRWLAQRYGYSNGLIDFGRAEQVNYSDLLEEIIELTREDQERLDCVAEVAHAREILERGTSAHQQLAVHAQAVKDGADEREALDAVVDWLITESVRDVVTD